MILSIPTKSTIFTTFCFSICFLFSCDCAYDYSYYVNNKTDGKLTVNWTNNGYSQSKDLLAGEEKVLFVTTHGVEPCKGGPFFQDVSDDLIIIQVIKDDSLVCKKDLRKNESWDFDDLGNYKTTLTNADF